MNCMPEVKGSVVTLTGHVEDDAVRDRIREVALKVEGVVFVVNKVKTDAQVLSAFELLMKRLRGYGGVIGQNWLLFVLAMTIIVLSLVLARLFLRYGDVLLKPFSTNPLLNSVLASLFSAAIVLAGLFTALQVFGIAQAVLSVMGLAGVAASGDRVRVPGHHGELHQLDPAGPAPVRSGSATTSRWPGSRAWSRP